MNFWQDKLAYSQAQIDSDISKIKSYFPNCIEVVKTKIEADRQGFDYIATLKGGVQIFIDAKTRMKGASHYWKHGEPELAFEIYSVVEEKKIGWTLNTKSKAHYILYTFDEADSPKFLYLPVSTAPKSFFRKRSEMD